MSRSVAITGGTGFIGFHAIRCLQHAGYRVRLLSRRSDAPVQDVEFRTIDWSKPETIKDALKGVDAIIHGASPHPPRTTSKGDEIIKEMVSITRTLLERVESVERFVYLSSMWGVVNSNIKNGTFDETTPYHFEGDSSPYAHGKHLSEELCLKLYEEKMFLL